MTLDPASYHLAKYDALAIISAKQIELEEVADHPMMGYAIDVLEALYQRIDALSWASCLACGAPIASAELCARCAERHAEGNDPFSTSKYSDGARGSEA